MCQKMVNMSTQIECSHCNEFFQTTVFYDHLKDIDPELRSNKSDSGVKSRVNDRRSTQQHQKFKNLQGIRGSTDSHNKSA
jgi:hypothetical protein